MSNKIQRGFRLTRIRSSSFTPEMKEELDKKFMELEAAKTDATAAEREAAIAAARHQTLRAKAQIQELELLQIAASADERIAAERTWIVYRDKDGDVVFDGITERLLRNHLRAQTEQVGRAMSQGADEGEIDRSGLYIEDPEDDGEERNPSQEN